MSSDNLDAWRVAGKASAEVLEFGRGLIVEGASVLEICKSIDDRVYSMGFRPAWPAQLSVNDVAAHFCPEVDSDFRLSSDVVKLDVGVCVDGFIGDNAVTVDLSGDYSDLLECCSKALESAIGIVKPGLKLWEIGSVVDDVISSAGFKSVKNLSGHGIDVFNFHAEPSIPNFNNNDVGELFFGDVIAIEPFASSGSGFVRSRGEGTVFRCLGGMVFRDSVSRKVMSFIERFDGLVFCKRWLYDVFPRFKVDFVLRSLLGAEKLEVHPPLADVKGSVVSQFEKTLVVSDSGCEVLTKL